MALSSECMQWCAQTCLTRTDIVRDGDLATVTVEAQFKVEACYSWRRGQLLCVCPRHATTPGTLLRRTAEPHRTASMWAPIQSHHHQPSSKGPALLKMHYRHSDRLVLSKKWRAMQGVYRSQRLKGAIAESVIVASGSETFQIGQCAWVTNGHNFTLQFELHGK